MAKSEGQQLESRWWQADVVDPETKHKFRLLVPAGSGEHVEVRLRRLNFVGALPRQTTLMPDPQYRDSVAAHAQEGDEQLGPASERGQGEVSAAAFASPPDLQRLQQALLTESALQDRHYVLHSLVKNAESDDQRIHFGWQWCVEWPVLLEVFRRCLGSPPPMSPQPLMLHDALERQGHHERAAFVNQLAEIVDRGEAW